MSSTSIVNLRCFPSHYVFRNKCFTAYKHSYIYITNAIPLKPSSTVLSLLSASAFGISSFEALSSKSKVGISSGGFSLSAILRKHVKVMHAYVKGIYPIKDQYGIHSFAQPVLATLSRTFALGIFCFLQFIRVMHNPRTIASQIVPFMSGESTRCQPLVTMGTKMCYLGAMPRSYTGLNNAFSDESRLSFSIADGHCVLRLAT